MYVKINFVMVAPLLDIKPYVSEFDISEEGKIGWLSERAKKVHEAKADERFQE